MLTDFGLQLRMIRLACGDRILDMAEKLGETPAFISKLERGGLVLPGGFDEEVIKAYHLNKRRADQVRLAFKRTRAREKQLTAPDDRVVEIKPRDTLEKISEIIPDGSEVFHDDKVDVFRIADLLK